MIYIIELKGLEDPLPKFFEAVDIASYKAFDTNINKISYWEDSVEEALKYLEDTTSRFFQEDIKEVLADVEYKPKNYKIYDIDSNYFSISDIKYKYPELFL
jgi:hypothetical protein